MTSDPEEFSDASVVLEGEYEPTPAAAEQVRRQVRVLLAGRRVTGQAAEDALLVVHELVANAIDHARTPFLVAVRVTAGAVKVRVRDRSRRVPQVGPADPRAYRGRGMRLIAALSQRWGFEDEDDGKTVWADLPI